MTKSSIPKGWRVVKFGDVVDNMNETTRDPEAIGLDRVVGLDHMDPDSLPLKRWDNLCDLHEGTSFTRVFRAGQVLFGKRRAYQRKVSLPDFDGICSGDILVFQPKNTELLSEFLPYLVQSDGFFDHALGTSAGSLSPRTKWQELVKYEFALPPIAEQHRIVQLISSIDETIALKSAVDFGQLINALYAQKNNTPDKNISLGEVCSLRTATVRELDAQSTINYIDLSSVSRGGGIDTSLVEEFEVSNAPSRAQRIISTGDVLVATVRPNLRAVARVSSREHGWVASTGFAVLRPRDEIDSLFLYGLVLTDSFTNYLVQRAIGSNYPAVRNGDVESLPIPLEIWENRQEISRLVGQILILQDRVKNELENVSQLRKAALQDFLGAEANV
jgi:type I restriction enzyme S subunit